MRGCRLTVSKTRVEIAYCVCSQRLKLAYDRQLSTFAFYFNLRRYSEEFRQHLHGKTTHEQWITFGSEWSKYLSGIGQGLTLVHLSAHLEPFRIQNHNPTTPF